MKSTNPHARSKASRAPVAPPRAAAPSARKPPFQPQSSSSEEDSKRDQVDSDESGASDPELGQASDADSDLESSDSSDCDVKRASQFDVAALRARYTAASSSDEDESDADTQDQSGPESDENEDSEADTSEEGDDSQSDEEEEEEEDEGLSFAEIAQRRETMGKKAYLESMAEQEERQKTSGGKKPSKPKRVNKNAPMEMSSKRPVSRYREAVKVQKIERRDPRFDNLSGHFNQGLFDKAYGFVYDLRAQEIQHLKQQLAKEKDPTEAQQLMRTIQAIENRERARKESDVKQRIKRDWRKQELSKVKEGKKPFFLKQSEQKKLALINKLKDRSDRELDKVAEKKRKRDAGKDWKWMPKRRRVADGRA